MPDVEEGDRIGYHPVGADDTRVVGIVTKVDANSRTVTVVMPDDPGIEERVPFDNIKALSKEDSDDV